MERIKEFVEEHKNGIIFTALTAVSLAEAGYIISLKRRVVDDALSFEALMLACLDAGDEGCVLTKPVSQQKYRFIVKEIRKEA